MFSDAVISTIQAAEGNFKVNGHSKNVGQSSGGHESSSYNVSSRLLQGEMADHSERTVQIVEPLIAQISKVNLNMDKFLSGEPLDLEDYLLYIEDEWDPALTEEVPAKEPQFSAVPKKSALKKSKNQTAFIAPNATVNGSNESKSYHMVHSSIANGYVHRVWIWCCPVL